MASPDRGARLLNPIWLISLFVGLTEVTTGVVATQTVEWVQGAFTIFSVTFPLLIAGAFFLMLWNRPASLYAPGDFTEHTSVSAYAAALRPSPNTNFTTLESVVRSTIEATLPQFLETKTSVQSREIVGQAVAVAEAELRSRTIEVDLSLIDLSYQEPLKIPVDRLTTVTYVLDLIWHAIRSHVRPLSINKSWILVDAATGTTLDTIGREWAKKHLRVSYDSRSLAEAGIQPGDRWTAYLLDSRGRRVLDPAR